MISDSALAERLAALRVEMNQNHLAVFVVPRADEHQLEYTPPSSDRLAWITGFTGTAGMALIGREHAALFVDGRYTLQAQQQAPAELWEHRHLMLDSPEAWLERNLTTGDRVGYVPQLHTPEGVSRLRAAAERAGASLCAMDANPIDLLWTDRPAPPRTAVSLYPETLAGESSESKRRRMAAELYREQIDALVISAPDNLAWLFNIRGNDVPVIPFVLGFAILYSDATAALFLDPARMDAGAEQALSAPGVLLPRTAEQEAFAAALVDLGGKRVRVDRASGSDWIVSRLTEAGATVDSGADPCTLAKACKTAQELDGIRAAHLRDGVALVRFLKWLSDVAPGEETEWTVAQKVMELRSEGENYRGRSFNTISAVGPNAALCHYSVARETALPLAEGEILLLDSGAQYLDGTTDVTRTLILGLPTPEMRRRYTQVLKGHIALSTARFPAGTNGSQIDILARQYLWQDGVDYDHGTGHGVGCFLSVHEGPHGISKRANSVGLLPGMIVSNEPGYYKADAFGIRIENLLAVKTLDPQPEGAELVTLGFETLTWAPYDRRLIEPDLLTDTERAWIDTYHARVYALLSPHLNPDTAAFLASATAPLNE